jgi:transglycosylase-like protein with SLT domain
VRSITAKHGQSPIDTHRFIPIPGSSGLNGTTPSTILFNVLATQWHGIVAWRESRFDPQAVSETGDVGVYQLAPVMVLALGVANPFDARENIKAGVARLAGCLRQAGGDVGRALCLYAHPGRCGE